MLTVLTKNFINKYFSKIFLLILLLTVILRIPTLFEPYWYGDEGIYLTLGEGVRQAVVLYKDLFDHKPPLIYWLAAIAGSIYWFKFILLIWHISTLVLFHKLAEKLFPGNHKLTLFATGIFALFTTIPLFEGNIANAELFMIGTTIAAFNLIIPFNNLNYKKTFWSGILLSLSFLFKVPSVFDLLLLPIVWFTFNLSLKSFKDVFKKNIILGTGFLIPVLLTLIYYSSRGALLDYLNTAGIFNSSYISSWDTSVQTSSGYFFTKLLSGGFQTRTLIVSSIILLLIIFRKKFDSSSYFVTTWLALATFAMLLSGRPYPHYIIQAIPSFSLAVAALSFNKQSNRFLAVPVLLIFSYSLVFYKFYTYPTFSYYANFISYITGQKTTLEYRSYFGSHVNRTYKLAEIIRSNTTKKDKIFVWGTLPELYALSRRIPPIKYTTSFHIKDLNAEAETMLLLGVTRPKLIINLPNVKESLPGFDEFLLQNYILIDEVEDVQIWRSLNPRLNDYM